ncbi:hypothetical protein Droror1_Dr00018131 [Drosera rotundifolia]
MSVNSSFSLSPSSEGNPKDIPTSPRVNVTDSSSDHSPSGSTEDVMVVERAGARTRSSGQAGTSAGPSQRAKALGANFESNLTTKEVVYYPGRFQCSGYEFRVPTLKERPFDARVEWMTVFTDCLSLGQHLPLCGYYQEVLGLYNISPAQLTPNSWALMAAFGVLCHELGFPPSAFMFCTFFKIAKVNQFRRHLCWVKGPGITLNPRWRKPMAKPDIPLLDDEVGLKTHIQRFIKDGTIREAKDLINPVLQKAAGLKTGNVPVYASSSSPGSSGSYSTSESFSDSGDSLDDPPPRGDLHRATESTLPSFTGVLGYTLRLDEESPEIFVDIMPPVGETDEPLPPADMGNRGATSTGAESSQMPKKAKGSMKRNFGKEQGEITPPPPPHPRRADKLPRTDDPPPPAVTKAVKTPRKQAGFVARNQPGEKEIFETRHSPEPTGPTRQRKRLAGNYEGCVPAAKCLGPLHDSSGPIPKIFNFLDPRIGVMLSEDNALTAAQAVATSSQVDLNHYVASETQFETEWIQKDIRVNLVRTLFATEAEDRMYMELKETAFNRQMKIRDLEKKQKQLLSENKELKTRVEGQMEALVELTKSFQAAEEQLAAGNEKEKEALAQVEELKKEMERWKNPQGEDLEQIRATHFDQWVDEFVNTDEGNDWLLESSKCACAEGYWTAVHNAKAAFPEVDEDFLMRKLVGCDNIGFHEDGEAYFIEDSTDASSSAADGRIQVPPSTDEVMDAMLGDTTALDAAHDAKDVARATKEFQNLVDCGLTTPGTSIGVEPVLAEQRKEADDAVLPGAQWEAGGAEEEGEAEDGEEEGRVNIPLVDENPDDLDEN